MLSLTSRTRACIFFSNFAIILPLCVISFSSFFQNKNSKQDNLTSQNIAEYLLSDQTVTIKPGDTFLSIISNLGVDKKIINSLVQSLEKKCRVSSLQVNGQLRFIISDKNGNKIRNGGVPDNIDLYMENLILKGSYNKSKKSYDFNEEKQKIITRTRFIQGYLGDNLYKNILNSGATSNIVSEYVRLLKNKVNFRRDLRKDTKFRILFKVSETPFGTTLTKGDILYASLSTGKKEYNLYKFKDKKYDDYFLEDGNVVGKVFFIKPIPGAPISSGYGYRIHPITGRKKFHHGIDFSAKRGTPIKASESGRIEKKAVGIGYGKYIVIRHGNKFSTLYAHMHKFNSNIRIGNHVKKGDTIGYVGNTGLSTAPHLHYEVRQYNMPINPGRVNTQASTPLKGAHLIAFKAQKSKINSIIEDKSKIIFTNQKSSDTLNK